MVQVVIALSTGCPYGRVVFTKRDRDDMCVSSKSLCRELNKQSAVTCYWKGLLIECKYN